MPTPRPPLPLPPTRFQQREQVQINLKRTHTCTRQHTAQHGVLYSTQHTHSLPRTMNNATRRRRTHMHMLFSSHTHTNSTPFAGATAPCDQMQGAHSTEDRPAIASHITHPSVSCRQVVGLGAVAQQQTTTAANIHSSVSHARTHAECASCSGQCTNRSVNGTPGELRVSGEMLSRTRTVCLKSRPGWTAS